MEVSTTTVAEGLSGYDIENDIFTFRFCLDNLLGTVNKASLYLNNSTTTPDWFKTGFKGFTKSFNTASDVDSLKPFFRTFYIENKDLFKTFDVTTFAYDFKKSGDGNYLISLNDSSYLDVTSIYTDLVTKYTKLKNTPRFHPTQFMFYFVMCLYNSLLDEDGGDELWDHLTVLSRHLDEVFKGEGPTSKGALTSTSSSVPPQLQSIFGMLSNFGLNMNGSTEAMESINRVFAKMSTNLDVAGSAANGGAPNIADICNGVSKALSDPEIIGEFENIVTNGKKVFEGVQDPTFQNNLKEVAQTFMNNVK